MAKKKKIKSKNLKHQKMNDFLVEKDDTFAFIAGYTSGGEPYGVTWEEWGKNNEKVNKYEPEIADENLPF